MGRYYNEDELYHFGILGQKWGVRRYENTDGTLTPEGKARYAKYGTSFSPGFKKKTPPSREELLKTTDPKMLYKYRDQLDDKELRERVNRIQTEQQLKGLKKNERSIGEEFIDRLGTAIMVGTVAAISGAVIASGKSAIGDMKEDMAATYMTQISPNGVSKDDWKSMKYVV